MAIPGHKFCYYFNEGPGYLFIAPLGVGIYGETQLVRGATDGKLYVRKMTLRFDTPFTTLQQQIDALNYEVRFYRPHPLVPRLVYPTLESHQAPIEGDVLPVMYSAFCNGGDLRHCLNTVNQRNRDLDPMTPKIPEPLVWKFIHQIVSVLDSLYFMKPPMFHGDLHSGNIFLHWPEGGNHLFPEFYLGDFGGADELLPNPENQEWAQKTVSIEISKLREVLHEMCPSIETAHSIYSPELENFAAALHQAAAASVDLPSENRIQSYLPSIPTPAPASENDMRWAKLAIKNQPVQFDKLFEIASSQNAPNGLWHLALVNDATFEVVDSDERSEVKMEGAWYGDFGRRMMLLLPEQHHPPQAQTQTMTNT